ncbi:MAG: flagellar basal body P-ring protein FlgI [Planctomycetota bacterium]
MPVRMCRLTVLFTALGFVFLGAVGCVTEQEWDRFWNPADKDAQRTADPDADGVTPSLRGTISPLVTLDGLRLTHVRGFGLVVDLVDTGGSDGPTMVKNYLIKEMRRRQDPSSPGLPAKQMLESKDTAMVEVTGLIPAGAEKDDRFDVVVRALGSQTKSLVGGRLFLCNLKIYADTPSGVIGGKTLATAAGPIFVSPFDRDGKPVDKVDLRTGWGLGGGIVSEERRVRLVLNDPRYSVAQRIVARLNGRYATDEPVAVGQSPSFVDLHIPKRFHNRKRLFLERVVHTPLNGSESFLRKRSKELADEIVLPEAPYETIALAWEAVGDIGLLDVRELYVHSSQVVSYYAGRTGLRLGDRRGMEVVARHAKDPASPYQDEAIDELGFAVRMYGAGEHLRKLLDEGSATVRIRAYRALRRRPHPAIETKVLYEDNLILDVVDSKGPYLVFVQRSDAPRIAIFGKQMRCQTPAMFPGDRRDGRKFFSQISAREGVKDLTVIFTNKRNNRSSPPLSAPLDVAELIEFLGGTPVRDTDQQMQGLGAPYSEITDVLSTFCDTRTIPGKFIVEDLTGREDYDDESGRDRPESEL